jgi:hypothetical protein
VNVTPLPPTSASPPEPEIWPEKVAAPPSVSVPLPRVTLPLPPSDAIALPKPLRSSVPDPPTVTALAEEKALAMPACRVPALTVVAPP